MSAFVIIQVTLLGRWNLLTGPAVVPFLWRWTGVSCKIMLSAPYHMHSKNRAATQCPLMRQQAIYDVTANG